MYSLFQLTRQVSAILTLSVLFLCTSSVSKAAKTLSINWSSDWTEFNDASGNALSQGIKTVNGDGAAVQLGYFTQATAGNLFAGDWVPLTVLGQDVHAFSLLVEGHGLQVGAWILGCGPMHLLVSPVP